MAQPEWLAEYARSERGRENARKLGHTRRVHGHAGGVGSVGQSPTYQSWRAMKGRCLYPKHRDYARYGGRGITIDPRWLGRDGFVHFLTDMRERPIGTSLDRIDNDGPYSPGNCRWADLSTQRTNHPQPRGWKQKPRARPKDYPTKSVPCNGGCGREGEVIVTAWRGWRCSDCRLVYQRAATAKSKARVGRLPCSVEGCDSPKESRGLCSKHYQRVRLSERQTMDRA